MGTHAQITMRANVGMEVRDAETGKVLHEQRSKNLVVTAGRNVLRDLLRGSLASVSAGTAGYFAIGTGTTAVAASDTTLGTEVARAAVTSTTVTDGAIVIKYFLPSGTANGSSLTEAGLFTASSGGTMIARTVHDAIAKTSSITITYSWTITFSAS